MVWKKLKQPLQHHAFTDEGRSKKNAVALIITIIAKSTRIERETDWHGDRRREIERRRRANIREQRYVKQCSYMVFW